MKISSPKIYTTRTHNEQMKYMWFSRRIDEEVNSTNDRSILPVLIRYITPKSKILEAGCGLCGWQIKLLDLGYNIEGVDFDSYVVSKVKEYRPEINVTVQDILSLACENGHYDVYISLGVIEHFENGPESALSEAYRVLSDDGLLFVTVPYNNLFRKYVYHPARNFYLFIMKLFMKRAYFSEYRFNKNELSEIITTAGFRIIETGTDDFTSQFKSMGLWADIPFCRGSKPYTLNTLGRILSFLVSYSKWITTSGIYIVAKKGSCDN